MTVTIYHNPNCGTSRNTLAMIRQSGEEPKVIEYLKHPPGRAKLVELIGMESSRICACERTTGAATVAPRPASTSRRDSPPSRRSRRDDAATPKLLNGSKCRLFVMPATSQRWRAPSQRIGARREKSALRFEVDKLDSCCS